MESYNLLVNSKYWNRKVLNAYWFAIMMSTLVESVNLIFTLVETRFYIVHFILIPTMWQGGIMAATEAVNIYMKKSNDYLLILTSALLMEVVVYVHWTVPVIFATLVLPSLMSIIFYNTRKVVFSFLISTVAYLAVWWFNPFIHDRATLTEVCTMIGVLGGGMMTALGIVSRGKEVTRYLNRAIESEQLLKQKTEAMEKLVKTDALTGLYNVREFSETLHKSMHHAHMRGEKLSLLLVDIDFFKNVNESYGHPAGDQVLKELGKVLISVCRSFDIVSRNGGEEFSIILPDCPLSHAIKIGERVRTAVSKHPFFLPNRECIAITVSIGVATYPETAANSEGLIQLADDGLYHAKRTGRNKVASLQRMEAGV